MRSIVLIAIVIIGLRVWMKSGAPDKHPVESAPVAKAVIPLEITPVPVTAPPKVVLKIPRFRVPYQARSIEGQVSSPPVPPIAPRKTAFGQGVEVELIGPKEGLITLCADESIFVDHKSTTRRFVLGEEIFGVGPGVLASVLADMGDRLQVKVLKGSWKGRIGWIASDEVRLRPTTEDASRDVVEGLTLDFHRTIYGELHRVGMQATFESEHQVPFSDLAVDPSVLARHEAVYNALEKKGRASLIAKYRQYRIDDAHLDRIDEEGGKERWPLPEVTNPYRH